MTTICNFIGLSCGWSTPAGFVAGILWLSAWAFYFRADVSGVSRNVVPLIAVAAIPAALHTLGNFLIICSDNSIEGEIGAAIAIMGIYWTLPIRGVLAFIVTENSFLYSWGRTGILFLTILLRLLFMYRRTLSK